MDNLAHFLQRNSSRFGPERQRLYVNPPAETEVVPEDSAVFTQDYRCLRAFDKRGESARFGTFPPLEDIAWSDIVLCAPREKDLLGAWLHWAATALPPKGRLWLAGENRAGIKSAGKHLEAFFGQWQKSDSARHCVLFRAAHPTKVEPFREAGLLQRWVCPHHSGDFPVCSMPGVFAHGRLDEGSALLLATLEFGELNGRVLDFGCGSGVLSVACKRANPSLHVSAVDTQALALESTRRSLALNRLRADVYPSDGLNEVKGPFEAIISNPPFHTGVKTQMQKSMRILQAVRNFLAPGGQLILVANRHLPYPQWLDGLFGGSTVVAANRRYRVLVAVERLH